MAYLNMNNMCNFEGRLVADPELSSIQAGGSNISKCKIKLAVDKNMTKDAKAKAKAEGKDTADFVPVDIIGPKADFVANYFQKGSGIRVVASFKTFNYQNKEGQQVYSYGFDAVDVGFTVGGNGNNQNNQQNNGNQNSGNKNNGNQNQNSQFQTIDDDDLPF